MRQTARTSEEALLIYRRAEKEAWKFEEWQTAQNKALGLLTQAAEAVEIARQAGDAETSRLAWAEAQTFCQKAHRVDRESWKWLEQERVRSEKNKEE